MATSSSPVSAISRKRRMRTRAASSGSCSKPLCQSGWSNPTVEHGVAGERQPVAAGRQADHAVPGGVAAGATDDHPRRHLVLLLERPQLAAVLVQELLGGRRSASGKPSGMETREKSGFSQNLTSAAATWIRRSGRSCSFTPSTSSPPMWSMCMWVSTTSVRSARSMPAASSRWTNCPAFGKVRVRPDPSVDEDGPAAAAHHDHVQRPIEHFRRQEVSSSQAARTAGSALAANIWAGSIAPHR